MKGLAVAVVVIAVVAILLGSGVYWTHFLYRVESIVRSAKEAAVIEAINSLELVKKSLSPALRYSFWQACYEVAGRGGFDPDCRPFWRVYGSVLLPNYVWNMQFRTQSLANTYLKVLAEGISPPLEVRVRRVRGAMPSYLDSIEQAIECAYWRCKKGCESEKVKSIEGCYDLFCDPAWQEEGRVCTSKHPVKAWLKADEKLSKDELGFAECLREEMDPFRRNKWVYFEPDIVEQIDTEICFGIWVNDELVYKELGFLNGSVQEGVYDVWAERKFLKILGLEVVFKVWVNVTSSVLEREAELVEVVGTSSKALTLEREAMRVWDVANTTELLRTMVLGLYEKGNETFITEDRIKLAVQGAVGDMPTECKQVEIGDVCENKMPDPWEVLNEHCPNAEATYRGFVSSRIHELEEETEFIELELGIDEMQVEISGSCDGDLGDPSTECDCKSGHWECPEDADISNETHCWECDDTFDPETEECVEGEWNTTYWEWVCDEYYRIVHDVNCSYDYYGSVLVSVNITDKTRPYPVYDGDKTALKSIILKFKVLSGTKELIEPPTNLCPPGKADVK
jgi:hypothetical protein